MNTCLNGVARGTGAIRRRRAGTGSAAMAHYLPGVRIWHRALHPAPRRPPIPPRPFGLRRNPAEVNRSKPQTPSIPAWNAAVRQPTTPCWSVPPQLRQPPGRCFAMPSWLDFARTRHRAVLVGTRWTSHSHARCWSGELSALRPLENGSGRPTLQGGRSPSRVDLGKTRTPAANPMGAAARPSAVFPRKMATGELEAGQHGVARSTRA